MANFGPVTVPGWNTGETISVYLLDGANRRVGTPVTTAVVAANGTVSFTGLATESNFEGTDGTTTGRFSTLTDPAETGGGSGGPVTPFRPEAYGAVRDGVTDDTAAINAAIADAFASATAENGYYAEVQFSAGIYEISGPLIQAGATKGNAQIPIPYNAPTAAKVTLALLGVSDVGAIPHWLQTVPQRAGTVLRTSLTGQAYSATFGQPSILGGPTPEGIGYGDSTPNFSNMLIVIDGIQVNGPVNPSVCGIDLRQIAAANVKSAAAQAEQVPSTAALPTANFMSGLLMPNNGNNAYSQVGTFACEGWYRGILMGEHCHLHHATILHCARGISFGGPNPHAMYVDVAAVENCEYILEYVDVSPVAWQPGVAGLFVHVAQLQTEPGTGTDATSELIHDPSNSLFGAVNVVNNGGSAFTLNGAVNVRVNALTIARGAFTPTLPATTIASAPIYRDMALTVSGGTVTAIAVDGVAQGITSGTVFVPAGKTFAITYSAAPTLRAVRF